jgi:HEAT repeat protein
MLPILPFDLLVPLALGTSVLVFLLVAVVFTRRLLLQSWSRGGTRAIAQAESLLLDAMAGKTSADQAGRWITSGRGSRFRAFVSAARSIQETNPALGRWLISSGISRSIAEVGAPTAGRGPGRWKRASALLAIGELKLDEHDALVRGLDDGDEDVAYVAAEALARLDTPQGARAIFERIGGQSQLLDSRLASLVEAMSCDVKAVLCEALRSRNANIVYWALNLAARKCEVELVEAVRPHLCAENANVRAAACECVGELKLKLTDAWLAPLLRDEVWYVQCHAAKALGAMQAEWAAEEISNLLFSPHWWVRQNATQALSDLGSVSEPLAEKVLRSDDRYARNGAVEVLAHLGWAETAIMRVHRTGDPQELELLERFGKSGGLGYLENALWVVPQTALPMLLELLERIGDRATYGRIRASRTRLAPELQRLALATADRVRTK